MPLVSHNPWGSGPLPGLGPKSLEGIIIRNPESTGERELTFWKCILGLVVLGLKNHLVSLPCKIIQALLVRDGVGVLSDLILRTDSWSLSAYRHPYRFQNIWRLRCTTLTESIRAACVSL